MGVKNGWLWGLTLAMCVGMLGGALFYQHVLGDEPCELCIYTRVWILCIALVAILGLICRHMRWVSGLFYLALVALTVGLGFDVWTLLSIDYNWPLSGACSFQANFPSWLPLDVWAPALFEVRNLCQPTPFLIFGITMADALAAACLAFVLIALYGLLGLSPSASSGGS
jgi:protein dithiol:quinone oxidoreductase